MTNYEFSSPRKRVLASASGAQSITDGTHRIFVQGLFRALGCREIRFVSMNAVIKLRF